ncbi:hypothetical protein [uncultured Winogradskyella sp.]|nr:hypothetical protein [uncultured Winogradskyella sp.]
MSFKIKESNRVISTSITKQFKGHIGFLLIHNNAVGASLKNLTH